MKGKKGDIRKDVFTKVFDLMKKGKTYANDGNHRDLKQDLDFSSWFTNYHLPYEHCELWGSDGKLTLKGVRLYQIAETYGWIQINSGRQLLGRTSRWDDTWF